MRKLLWIFLIFPLALAAQLNNPQVRDSTTDPTGVACTSAAPILRYTATNIYFGCGPGNIYAALGGGSGSGTVSGQAANVIGKATNSTTTGAQSALSDDGAIVSSAEPVSAPSIVAGAPTIAAKAALPTGAQGYSCDESSTVGIPASAVDYLRCDATSHQIVFSFNGSVERALGQSTFVYDDFTRANGVLTAPWMPRQSSGSPLPGISSNLLTCTSGICFPAYYNQTIGANQYVETVIVALPSSGNNVALNTRVTPSLSASFSAYACYYIAGTGVQIYKSVLGVSSQVTTTPTTYLGSVTAGATFGMRAVGSILTCYVNGVPVIQGVDVSLTTGDFAGLIVGDATAALGPFIAKSY